METITSYDSFKIPALTIGDLQKRAPSVFATTPFSSTSPNYRFISTAQIVSTLLEAGFEAVAAQQTNARGERSNYARHMLRFRSMSLPRKFNDVVPQIVLINSHDGSSAYQMRAGLYRTLCMNGLLESRPDVLCGKFLALQRFFMADSTCPPSIPL